MRRVLLLVPLLLLAVGCDRTDQEFGDHGVVRIGVDVDDMVMLPGTGAFVVTGHRPGTAQVVASNIDVEGRTAWSATLPATFATLRATAAAVDTSYRDPNYLVDVIGDDLAGGPGDNLQVAQLSNGNGQLIDHYGVHGIASTGVTWSPSVDPIALAGPEQGLTIVLDHGGLAVLRLTDTGAVAGITQLDVPVTPIAATWAQDGGLLIAGSFVRHAERGIVTDSDIAVVKARPDGTLDPSFGSGGLALVDFNARDVGAGVVQQPDGRVVAGGTLHVNETSGQPTSQAALAGLTATGQPDASFGWNGRTLVDDDLSSTIPRFVQGGPGYVLATTFQGDVVTRGFTVDGVVEDSWGDHGVQINDLGGDARVAAIGFIRYWCLHRACGPNARIIVAASADAPGGALLGLNE